tara:strand:+ start:22282 stop:23067 length:786 start_codon:yes stop_codon:yes gene_type:complete
MKKLTIVKVGGKVIDETSALDAFLKSFSTLEGEKILIHGGGKIASDFGKKLGVEPKMVEGRRITDAETIDLVTMVYGGLVSKRIVSKLQALKVNAIGLTGADANVIPATKRPVGAIDYGFVGDVKPENINTEILKKLIDSGLIPVLAPLTHDGEGHMLNTNADTIAASVAAALAQQFEVKLIYCFEQPGVLSDFENKLVIPEINRAEVAGLKESGVINEGMLPKMDCALLALTHGAKSVRIGSFENLQALANDQSGTLISN